MGSDEAAVERFYESVRFAVDINAPVRSSDESAVSRTRRVYGVAGGHTRVLEEFSSTWAG